MDCAGRWTFLHKGQIDCLQCAGVVSHTHTPERFIVNILRMKMSRFHIKFGIGYQIGSKTNDYVSSKLQEGRVWFDCIEQLECFPLDSDNNFVIKSVKMCPRWMCCCRFIFIIFFHFIFLGGKLFWTIAKMLSLFFLPNKPY